MLKFKDFIPLIVSLIICVVIVVLFNNYDNKKLANVEDIKTDKKFENVTYDKEEDIWDDSVLGILTIEKIGLNATVKEGTSSNILLNNL